MYNLRSSDIDNSKYISAAEKFSPDILQKYVRMEFRYIQEIILHDDIDEPVYDNAMFALTLCDEFAVPVLKRQADLMFFVLHVNRAFFSKESTLRITNISQAQLYYEQYGGSFREATRSAQDRNLRWVRFRARHRWLFPECNIDWQIPIKFFRDGETGKQMITVAGQNACPYALASIEALGLKDVKIPRMIYMMYFAESTSQGRVLAKSTDEIRLMFDEVTDTAAEQTMRAFGLDRFFTIIADDNTDYYYDDAQNALIARKLNPSSDIFSKLGNEEESIYWTQLDNFRYRFLNRGAEYVPVIAHGAYIIYK